MYVLLFYTLYLYMCKLNRYLIKACDGICAMQVRCRRGS